MESLAGHGLNPLQRKPVGRVQDSAINLGNHCRTGLREVMGGINPCELPEREKTGVNGNMQTSKYREHPPTPPCGLEGLCCNGFGVGGGVFRGPMGVPFSVSESLGV